ncbi:ATP-binding protein [Algoriphagus terrigena]|uniref:ATP-binding protein n=1 Tax=Algoriphagus terrigena TaxID=344884 RepID=UPI00041CCD98|nr:RNA-binding domain-containing protein [Algoriphagus terrigena]
MALPVNIEELVHGNTIEWERLEFKQGWNPEDTIHSMCAFANDLHNWGGGYIIVGIGEREGQPILPPAGLPQNQLDTIQGEIIRLAVNIQPNYFPITQPYVLDGQHILVIWCPGGDNRPYSAPRTLGEKGQRHYYVRIGSRSIAAQGDTLRRLLELTARIPFDDRVNNRARLDDLDFGLIREYLQEIRSELLEESIYMPFPDVCKAMLIAKGPSEDLRPVNVGLLFFCKHPERFFERAWIELVWHRDDSGKNFREATFKGPLHEQLRDALSFIKSYILSEQVIKHADQAESERFFNYPFGAIEEALSNAVYHKSYEHGAPIEIQIFPDSMTILSHPGPVPPVNAQVLSTQKRIIAREYRNRRIGDFLKDLKLTEGRGTGFPTIYNAMERNGSPSPTFETDEQTYVLVTLPARRLESNTASIGAKVPLFNIIEDVIEYGNGVGIGVSNGARDGVSIINDSVHDRVKEMLMLLLEKKKRAELFRRMGLSNQTKNRERYLDPLIYFGWVQKEHEEDTHPGQRYFTSESGKRILELM